MFRRQSISPNAPVLDPPTIKQDRDEKGLTIRLECCIHSMSEPVCTWYHMDERVKNDERHKSTVEKDGETYISCLKMTQVKPKDAGKYTVKVNNGSGEQYATVFSYVEKSRRESICEEKH